jgi:hypothetical protein
VSAADEVVDNFFRDGHQPHRMDALQTLFPMLKKRAQDQDLSP